MRLSCRRGSAWSHTGTSRLFTLLRGFWTLPTPGTADGTPSPCGEAGGSSRPGTLGSTGWGVLARAQSWAGRGATQNPGRDGRAVATPALPLGLLRKLDSAVKSREAGAGLELRRWQRVRRRAQSKAGAKQRREGLVCSSRLSVPQFPQL